MPELIEKVLPHNLDAERGVLGSMLIEKDCALRGIDLLKENYFYSDVHQKIFRTISELVRKNKVIDLITITDELERNNQLEEIGGVSYLTELMNAVTTTAHFDYYIEIVKDRALLRNLISVSNQIIIDCYSNPEDPQFLLDKAQQSIFEISQYKQEKGFVPIKDLIPESISMIEKSRAHKGPISGISTGFVDLDEKITGLHPSNLIIVAGRPAMGKTSFILEIAQYVAINEKLPVAIFSLEMSCEELMLRMLCSLARVNIQKVRSSFLSSREFAALTKAAEQLEKAPIYIDDSSNLSLLEIKARTRRLKAEKGLGLTIIDYLQLLAGRSGKIEYRQQEISEIMRSLKVTSKELSIPIIAVSQLSRAPEQRGDRRPQLSDLRESGTIEQDADIVLFLYREEYYKDKKTERGLTDKDEKPEEGLTEVIIGKQRNGPTGTVNLTFIKEYARFENFKRG